jgi:hypothetical protein
MKSEPIELRVTRQLIDRHTKQSNFRSDPFAFPSLETWANGYKRPTIKVEAEITDTGL